MPGTVPVFKIRNILELSLVAFSFFFPHYLGIIFIYPPIVLGAIWFFLKYISHEDFSDLLFRFDRFTVQAFGIGLTVAILLSAFFQLAWDPLIHYLLPNHSYDLSDFASLKGNVSNYVILLIAFLVGGFYEEIIFHGFLFTRLERVFDFKGGAIISFIVTNAIFGLYHYQQGVKGILLTTVAGAVYHLLILRFGRNLWYGLFCHTFFDFIGLTMIYLGYLE